MNINKVILIGRLGQDAELAYTQAKTALCKFSIATSEKFKDGREELSWHACQWWGKNADVLSPYLKKGKPVYLEGKLKYQQWTDKQGVQRSKTTIEVRDLKLLGGKEKEESTQNELFDPTSQDDDTL